jgi:hypothetical protein
VTPEQREVADGIARRLAAHLDMSPQEAMERLIEAVGAGHGPILANLGVRVSYRPIARAAWVDAGHPYREPFRRLAPKRIPRAKRRAWIQRRQRALAPIIAERFRRAALDAVRQGAA